MKKIALILVVFLSFSNANALYCCLDGVFGGPNCFGGNGTCSQLSGCGGSCKCWDTNRMPVMPLHMVMENKINNSNQEVVIEKGKLVIIANGKESQIALSASQASDKNVYQVFYDETLDLYIIKIFNFETLVTTGSYEGSIVETMKVKLS